MDRRKFLRWGGPLGAVAAVFNPHETQARPAPEPNLQERFAKLWQALLVQQTYIDERAVRDLITHDERCMLTRMMTVRYCWDAHAPSSLYTRLGVVPDSFAMPFATLSPCKYVRATLDSLLPQMSKELWAGAKENTNTLPGGIAQRSTFYAFSPAYLVFHQNGPLCEAYAYTHNVWRKQM